jgi:hypothetical protein
MIVSEYSFAIYDLTVCITLNIPPLPSGYFPFA